MNQFDLILWVAITMHSTNDNVMSVYQHNVVNYRDFSTFIARELTFFLVSFEDAQSRERSGHLAVEEKEDKLFK